MVSVHLSRLVFALIEEFRGIALDVNLFASAITLRPFQVSKTNPRLAKDPDAKIKTDFEIQEELKHRIKSMLENEQKIPRELIFVGRAQRIVQSLNQVLLETVERQ